MVKINNIDNHKERVLRKNWYIYVGENWLEIQKNNEFNDWNLNLQNINGIRITGYAGSSESTEERLVR